jgi:hypothetical protein
MALAALRRCLVCEWQGLMVEAENTDEIGPPCQTCGAPTERIASTRVEPTPAINEHAAALGRLGGLKGGPARAAALTARRRSQIARRAARTRWNRRKR